MRGKRTPTKKIEEVKALSIAFEPREISEKTEIPLRTVHAILAKKSNPVIERKRAEKKLEIVDEVFCETKEEIQKEVKKLKQKGDMLLDNLTPEKAAKARTTELTTSYGILFDKRRIIEGKSTSNLAVKIIKHPDLTRPDMVSADNED
jgi:hypothetical protein